MPRPVKPQASSAASDNAPAAAELMRAMARLREQLDRTTRERDRLTIQLAQSRRTSGPANATFREPVADADSTFPERNELSAAAQAEIEMARQVIASLEEQCTSANKRAASTRAELDQERRTVLSLRRRIAQLTDGWRTRAPATVWGATPGSTAVSLPEDISGQRATVQLAAVS